MNESINLMESCRVCGSDEKYANLFYNINRILLKNLASLLQCELTERNGSKWMCRDCVEQVEEFIRFRQKYEETFERISCFLEEIEKVPKEERVENEFEIEALDESYEKASSVGEEEIVVDEASEDTKVKIDPTASSSSQNVHEDPKKFQCTTCFKTYLHHHSLIRHTKTAHEFMRYACPFCPSEFTQKSSLNEHVKNLHREVDSSECYQIFVCEFCSRTFNTQKMLQQHLRSHEERKSYETTVTSETMKEQEVDTKKYRKQCQICGLFFKHIDEHRLTHETEKTFHCLHPECGKTFKFKTSLDVHSRIHNGERNFSCNICNKSFRVSHHLKEHMSVHAVEKSFICPEPQCLKKFSSKLNLYKHSKLHLNKSN